MIYYLSTRLFTFHAIANEIKSSKGIFHNDYVNLLKFLGLDKHIYRDHTILAKNLPGIPQISSTANFPCFVIK